MFVHGEHIKPLAQNHYLLKMLTGTKWGADKVMLSRLSSFNETKTGLRKRSIWLSIQDLFRMIQTNSGCGITTSIGAFRSSEYLHALSTLLYLEKYRDMKMNRLPKNQSKLR